MKVFKWIEETQKSNFLPKFFEDSLPSISIWHVEWKLLNVFLTVIAKDLHWRKYKLFLFLFLFVYFLKKKNKD
jgi:hypothetical protein